MSRRRKRNKQQGEEEAKRALQESSENQFHSPPKEVESPSKDIAEDRAPEQLELPQSHGSSHSVSQPDGAVDEVDIDLPDLFDEGTSSPTLENDFQLPTASDKKALRPARKVVVQEEFSGEEPLKERLKRHSPREQIADSDELGELDDGPIASNRSEATIPERRSPEPLSELGQEAPAIEEESEAVSEQLTDPVAVAEEATIEDPTPEPTVTEPFSYKALFANQLKALSTLERVSVAVLAAILLIFGVWASSAVAARVPENAGNSRLKFPLKGQKAVLAGFDSYWRSPVREGEGKDEGVSQSIELIPVAVVTLDPQSKAKSLRFLFRDENGSYVGDSSTVKASGGKFLPSDDATTRIAGSKATISATTGFINRGEIISYISDDKFRWNLVIFESADGKKFTELTAIPISAKRKDL